MLGGNITWVNLHLVGMRVSKNITFDKFSMMNLIKSLFLVCSGATATNADTVRKKIVKLETNFVIDKAQLRLHFEWESSSKIPKMIGVWSQTLLPDRSSFENGKN